MSYMVFTHRFLLDCKDCNAHYETTPNAFDTSEQLLVKRCNVCGSENVKIAIKTTKSQEVKE